MDPLIRRRVKPIKRRNRRKPLSEEIRSVYRMLGITLVFLGAASTVAYLYVNGIQSTNGYELQGLKTENEKLLDELRAIEHMNMETQSMIQLEEWVKEKGYIESGAVIYLDSEESLAQKQ